MQKRFLPILLVSLSLSIGGCSISTKKEEVVTEKHQEKKSFQSIMFLTITSKLLFL